MGLVDSLIRAWYEVPPAARGTAVIAMSRRDAAGIHQVGIGTPDEDWRNWPADGHTCLGRPLVLDDALDRPQIRYQPYLGPPLPAAPPAEPGIREVIGTLARAVRRRKW